MEKITKCQLIAIMLATVIGIAAAVVINYNTPEVRIAFTQSQPTEQAYETLKIYALGIARGQYSDQNAKELKVDGPKIEGEVLKVNIETSQMYGVQAEFPISYEVDKDLKSGTINIEGKILYDNATYLEYTQIKSKCEYIIRDILGVLACTFLVYCIVSEIERKLKKV